MIEQPVAWEDYVPVETITIEDAFRMQGLVGLPLPEDYRELLLQHQGMAPTESGRCCVNVHEQGLQMVGGVIPIKAKKAKRNLNDEMERQWSIGYPPNLLYFAHSLGSCHFALDYVGGRDLPPSVVYVNPGAPQSDREREEWRSGSDPLIRVYAEHGDPNPEPGVSSYVVFHVADSITDFLAMLVKDPDYV